MSLQTTAEYDTFGATAQEMARRAVAEADAGRPAAIPGFLPDQLIAPISSGIGVQLLRRMGWREGRGVGPSDGLPDEQHPGDEQGDESSLWGHPIVGASGTPVYLLEPKTDLYGFGYDPFRVRKRHPSVVIGWLMLLGLVDWLYIT